MPRRTSFPANSQTPLEKGKACINCRRRKIKCDAVRPMCGPCSRFTVTFGDCDYTEDGPTASQRLEERIALVQARIDQLVQADIGSPAASSVSNSPPLSPSPISSASPAFDHHVCVGPTEPSMFSSRFIVPRDRFDPGSADMISDPLLEGMARDLPPFILQALVHNFLHDANGFGLFLDVPFVHSKLAEYSFCSSSVPSTFAARRDGLLPGLRAALDLLAISGCMDARIRAYEPRFLAEALQKIHSDSSLNPHDACAALQILQASTLLTHYFFHRQSPL